jgi:hypothetical protein
MGARVETQLPFDPLSVIDEDHGPTDKDGELLAKKSRLDGPIKFNISKNLGAQFKRLLYNGVEKRKAKEMVGWGGGDFSHVFHKNLLSENLVVPTLDGAIYQRLMAVKNSKVSEGSIDLHEKDLYKIQKKVLVAVKPILL